MIKPARRGTQEEVRALVLFIGLLPTGLSACGTPLGRAWRATTAQHRPSFESPGDAVTLSPTVDTGIGFPVDPNGDCSTCPPR